MIKTLLSGLISTFRSRQALVLENLALCHQLEVLQRNSNRPALKWRDRAFWDILASMWPEWGKALYIVKPDTVIK
jgi:hypothetical protein